MKIEAMLHTIKAASAVSQCKTFLVIGSQAILGHCQDQELEFSFNESSEIDLVPVPDNALLSDLIDGTLGENSPFHYNFGYYVHGVGMKTAVFPDGWEQRLKNLELNFENESIMVYFPSPEDIALAKYAAGREKDRRFIKKMVQEGFLDPSQMEILVEKLPINKLGQAKITYIKKLMEEDISFLQEIPSM